VKLCRFPVIAIGSWLITNLFHRRAVAHNFRLDTLLGLKLHDGLPIQTAIRV